MVVRTTTLPISQTTAFKSQKHPFHKLKASPFPFLTGPFLATLLVPFTRYRSFFHPTTSFNAGLHTLLATVYTVFLLLTLPIPVELDATLCFAFFVPQRLLLAWDSAKEFKSRYTVGPLFFPLAVFTFSALIGTIYLFASGIYLHFFLGAARMLSQFGRIPNYPLLVLIGLLVFFAAFAAMYIFGVITIDGRPVFTFSGGGYFSRILRQRTPLTGPYSHYLATRMLQRMRSFCVVFVTAHILLLKYLYAVYFAGWLFLSGFSKFLSFLGTTGEVYKSTQNLRAALWKHAVLSWEGPQLVFPTPVCVFLFYVIAVGILCHLTANRRTANSTQATFFLLFILLSPPELILLGLLLESLFPQSEEPFPAARAGGGPSKGLAAKGFKVAAAPSNTPEEVAALALSKARLDLASGPLPGTPPVRPSLTKNLTSSAAASNPTSAEATYSKIMEEGQKLATLRDPVTTTVHEGTSYVTKFSLNFPGGALSADSISEAGAVTLTKVATSGGAKAGRYKLTVASETVGIAAGSIVVGVFIGTTFFNTGPANGNTSGSGGSTPTVTAVPAPASGVTATSGPAKIDLNFAADSLLSDFLDGALGELLLSFSPFLQAATLLAKLFFCSGLLLLAVPTVRFITTLAGGFVTLIHLALYRAVTLYTLPLVIFALIWEVLTTPLLF